MKKLLLLSFFLLSTFFLAAQDAVVETGTGTINGHVWVDLGLSVKWATCNVGASTPEAYGKHYAWGEVSPQKKNDQSSYKHCNGAPKTLKKYCVNNVYGNVDDKETLELVDDAAHVVWGGAWRMPTHKEMQELRDSCDWEWTTMNDVKGYMVTSKKEGYEGHYIFLPASGFHFSTNNYVVGQYGYYWTSSLAGRKCSDAWNLIFDFSYVDAGVTDNRYAGFAIRPVCR